MYQNDDKSSYEYHYSYRSDSEGFRPDQTPAPMELQKPKRGRAKRVAAGILCGVLLVGGSVGAGWLLKDRLDGRGGILEIKFNISVDHQVAGENQFKIRVRESGR